MKDIEIKAINTLRVLAMEEISKANSGHPGIALGAAPIIHALYKHVMTIDPTHPEWENRDRFVLAAGHGSSVLYAMLHLAGYNVKKEDLMNFRQLSSLTPGHPEKGYTPGVDATSGPLGQGLATAVGMAIAEENLHKKFPSIDHYTYCLCSDAELQEGIGCEALSLGGHLKLSKLIVLMDSNDIQLDGKVDACFSENVEQKVKAANWNYIRIEDGNDSVAICRAIVSAKEQDKPTFIEVKTVIGYGSSLAGTNKVHGAPLPQDEVIEMRKTLGGNAFDVDNDVLEYYQTIANIGQEKYREWRKAYPNFDYGMLDVDFDSIKNPELEGKATRTIVGKALEVINSISDKVIAGSADLASSCKVKGGNGDFSCDNREGRNILFGVREHAMGGICNGIALHGGLLPVCGGFFVFSDYCKPAIRMSALSGLPVTYIFSHDSIAVGEDGPTHQPIEQVSGLRCIPNLNVIRPCNNNETIEALDIALNSKHTPTVILTSRQDLTPCNYPSDVKRGAYIIKDAKKVKRIIIATGSEVSLALEIAEELGNTRVVSMPCTKLFDAQSDEYKEKVLPSKVRERYAIEMSDAIHMYKYVGLDGKVFGINTFGKSGKAKDVIKNFGFTKDNILNCIKGLK